jgi:SAM-dependent methyltransferase
LINSGPDSNDVGQSTDQWGAFWLASSPEAEIRMWDFYGGRAWILKHAPRHGKVLEAGSGLGRYVFLLSRLGVDIEGVDFHEHSVRRAQQWAGEHGFDVSFRTGDVTQLPYADASLSGYVSLGVIEHFREGPARAVAEACRILRPGGVAIITTPAPSFSQRGFRAARLLKDGSQRIRRRGVPSRPFFQHWYSARRLSQIVAASGLRVVLAGTEDLRYAAWELGAQPGGWAFRLCDRLEATSLRRLGAQSLTVSIKFGERMHCFLCGEQSAGPDTLRSFYLPICRSCESDPIAAEYRPGVRPTMPLPCLYEPAASHVIQRKCSFCSQVFTPDPAFEPDHGFDRPACSDCLARPDLSLLLSNRHLRQVWRSRP